MAFPDTCIVPGTPPVPTPFPNSGQNAQASGASGKVLIDNKKSVTVKSEIPMSAGDEAGTLGGVMSGVFKNKIQFKMGSSKVLVEGNKLVYHTCMTGHNGANSNMPAGGHLSPSQSKVTVMPG
jgi:hypothetical protein